MIGVLSKHGKAFNMLQPILSQGALTVLLAPEVSDADARWILEVITNHWFEDIVPTDVPEHLSLITRMVIAEQDIIKADIADRHEKRAEAARQAANARWGNRNANGCERMRTDANAYNRNAIDAIDAIKRNETKENKKKLNNTEKENDKEKELSVDVGVGDINFSSSGSVYYTNDPARYAMNLVGRKNQRDYQTFASFLRKLGMHTFCEIVNEFDSQKRQGEMNSVKNLAAVLVTKLKNAK